MEISDLAHKWWPQGKCGGVKQSAGDKVPMKICALSPCWVVGLWPFGQGDCSSLSDEANTKGMAASQGKKSRCPDIPERWKATSRRLLNSFVPVIFLYPGHLWQPTLWWLTLNSIITFVCDSSNSSKFILKACQILFKLHHSVPESISSLVWICDSLLSLKGPVERRSSEISVKPQPRFDLKAGLGSGDVCEHLKWNDCILLWNLWLTNADIAQNYSFLLPAINSRQIP